MAAGKRLPVDAVTSPLVTQHSGLVAEVSGFVTNVLEHLCGGVQQRSDALKR